MSEQCSNNSSHPEHTWNGRPMKYCPGVITKSAPAGPVHYDADIGMPSSADIDEFGLAFTEYDIKLKRP